MGNALFVFLIIALFAVCIISQFNSKSESQKESSIAPSTYSKAQKKSTIVSCPCFRPYVILDVETTGLYKSNDKIIQISAIKYDTNGMPIDFYNTYLNPGCPIPAKASQINGITNSMVSGAPNANQIQDAFLAFVEDYLIVGYNVMFDLRFLNHTFNNYFDEFDYVDVLKIARDQLYMPNYKLSTVAVSLGFKSSGSFHNSFTDCEAVAAILNNLKVNLCDYIQTLNPSSNRADHSRDNELLKYYYDYLRGEEERKAGNLELALQLFDEARKNGYDCPTIYESYAKVYRKLKDYEREIAILDDASQRFKGEDAIELIARKRKAQELLATKQRKEVELQQKAEEKRRKAEERQQREALKASKISKPSNRRAVIQYTDDGTILNEYESIASASKQTGISEESIRKTAHGQQKHGGGFCWRFVDNQAAPEIQDSSRQ